MAISQESISAIRSIARSKMTSDDVLENNPLFQRFTADGTIGIKAGVVALSSSANLAVTLPAPINVLDDGKQMIVVDQSGSAHVLSATFSPVGSTGTFAGTKGQNIHLVANAARWYVVSTNGVTIS